jgi:hypothetical protein
MLLALFFSSISTPLLAQPAGLVFDEQGSELSKPRRVPASAPRKAVKPSPTQKKEQLNKLDQLMKDIEREDRGEIDRAAAPERAKKSQGSVTVVKGNPIQDKTDSNDQMLGQSQMIQKLQALMGGNKNKNDLDADDSKAMAAQIAKQLDQGEERAPGGMDLGGLAKQFGGLDQLGFDKGGMEKLIQSQIDQFSKSNPLSYMSKEQVQSMILSRVEGTPIAKILNDSPKIMDFIASFMTDKQALPSLISIAKRKRDLMNYGVFSLVCFIGAFFLSMQVGNYDPFLKKIAKKMSIRALPMVLGFGLFYFMFKKELAPTVDLAMKTLF